MLAYHTDYTDMLSGKPSAEAIVDEAGILSARSIAPVSVKSPDWINSQDMIIERKDLQTGGTLVVIKDKSNPFLRLAANNAEIRDRFLEAIPAGETLSEVKGSEKVVLQNGRLFQIRTVEGFREPQRKIAPRTAEAAR
jgi:hypothetical protein